MNVPRTQPLWLRLGVALGILLLTVELLFGWFLITREQHYIEDAAERKAAQFAAVLAPRYQRLLVEQGNDALLRAVAQDAAAGGLRLQVEVQGALVANEDGRAAASNSTV
ncbi:MAG: hypothetical protein AAFX05_06995, partial [Planctomycetota bacterium]